MSEKLVYQQGDVLFFRIAALPAKRQTVQAQGHHVLALGETTGHAHAIRDLEHCDLYCDENGMLYIENKTPVDVIHEEHKAITIQPGVYRIGRVQEIDPFTEEIRAVQD